MAITKKQEPELMLRTRAPENPAEYAWEEASTADIVRRAIEETKELVSIEIEIAKNEAKLELERTKRASIGFAVALAAGVLVLCMLAVAIVIAAGDTVGAALVVAACLLVIGGIAALVGYAAAPKKPFERVRERLGRDVKQLKEHVA
jgi:uncharacterized membrane protein YqjE